MAIAFFMALKNGSKTRWQYKISCYLCRPYGVIIVGGRKRCREFMMNPVGKCTAQAPKFLEQGRCSSFMENYMPFEQLFLVFNWILVETEALFMGYQEHMYLKSPILGWIVSEPSILS